MEAVAAVAAGHLVDVGGEVGEALGVAVVALGTAGLALTVTGADSVSTWEMAPSLVVVGIGLGSSIGQLFDFILAGVGTDEVGSASGVLEATQQLAGALGVAVLGTIFFSAFGDGLPSDALAVTAWACLIPLAAAFGLIFLLSMRAREQE